MPYSLLIADDEPIIVQRMFDVFSQTEIFNTNCFLNGIQALEFAQENPIDIALLDISMPQVNGIELMHRLKSLWPDIFIVFLTGHRNFEYAYESLEQDNVKYVLKSDGEEKIKETIFACVENIEYIRKNKELIESSQLIIQKFTPQILSSYFTQLLVNRNAFETASFILERQNITKDALYTLILCGIEEKQATGLKLQIYYHLMQLSDQMLTNEHITFPAPQPYQFCIALKHFDDDLSEVISLFEKLQNIFYKTYSAGFSVLLTEQPCTINDFSFNYHALANVLDTHPHMVLLMKKDTRAFAIGKNAISCKSEIIIDSLHKALISENEDEFSSCCLELLSQISDHIIDQENRALIESKLMALCIEAQTLYQIDLLNQKALFSMNFSELIDVLTTLSMVIHEKKNIQFNENSNEIIKSINQYINQHLDENLSLEKLGKHVFLNPSYLSRLYKQTTGINISDYIVAQRIEYAKEHLTKTDDKITQIAAVLGFKTTSYFSVFFKKHTDFSPTEYREKYGELI